MDRNRWLEWLVQDVRFACRTFLRARTFTCVVLLTLALGIGANTAVFSAVDGILLRDLPYPHAGQLTAVWSSHFVSAAELAYLQTNARSYDGGVAAFSPDWGSVLTQPNLATQVSGARTSANFFRMLGVAPLIGRTFRDGESAPGANDVVLLSSALWKTRFGGDSNVLNTSIILDGTPTLVIGVMPADFSIFDPGAELWMPLAINPSSSSFTGAIAFLVGRLKPTVSADAALAELRTLVPDMRRTFAFDDTYGKDTGMETLHDHIVGPVRPILRVLFGAAALLVLISAANVANLLIARASARHQEVQVRVALGASRGRIVRQLLAESLLLASAGGIAGVAIGVIGVRAIKGFLPPTVPRIDAIVVDWRVLVVSALVTGGVGVCCGLAPALLANGRGLQHAARGRTGDGSGVRGKRMRAGMVIAEIALALVLVIGAGLMAETMWSLSHVDPGFRADHVLTLRVQPSSPEFASTATRLAYFDDAFATLRAVPGVERVGAIQQLPLSGPGRHRDVEIEGRPVVPGATPFQPGYYTVGGDYFDAMRIPVRQGRAFQYSDDLAHPAVVVVNDAFAQAAFPGENPVGKRIRPRRLDWATIVGVVGNVRYNSVNTPPVPEFFLPMRQSPQWQMQIVLRTSVAPVAVAQTAHEHLAAVNRAVPVSNVEPLSAHAAASVAQPRVIMLLLLAFAGIGLTLGVVGIYGVVGYNVGNRKREIGIRLALGAKPMQVLRILIRDGVQSALAGIALGLGLALLLSHTMRTLVFGVTPTHGATYACVALLLFGAALIASWLPARRALRNEPIAALRSD